MNLTRWIALGMALVMWQEPASAIGQNLDAFAGVLRPLSSRQWVCTSQAFTPKNPFYFHSQNRSPFPFKRPLVNGSTSVTLHAQAWPIYLIPGVILIAPFLRELLSSANMPVVLWPLLTSIAAASLFIRSPGSRKTFPTILILTAASGFVLWTVDPLEGTLYRSLWLGFTTLLPGLVRYQAVSHIRPIGPVDRLAHIAHWTLLSALISMGLFGYWQYSQRSSAESPRESTQATQTNSGRKTVAGLRFQEDTISYLPMEDGEVIRVYPRSEFNKGDKVLAWIGLTPQTLSALTRANQALAGMKQAPIALVSAEPNFDPQNPPLYVLQPTDQTATDRELRDQFIEIVNFEERYKTIMRQIELDDKRRGTTTNPLEDPELMALLAEVQRKVLEINITDRHRDLNASSVVADGNFTVVQPLLSGETDVHAGAEVRLFTQTVQDLTWAYAELSLTDISNIQNFWRDRRAGLQFQISGHSFVIPMAQVAFMQPSHKANSTPLEGASIQDPDFGAKSTQVVEWLIPNNNLPSIQARDREGMTYQALTVDGSPTVAPSRDTKNEFFATLTIEGTQDREAPRVAHPALARAAALDAQDVQSQITSLNAQANREEEMHRSAGGGIPARVQARIDDLRERAKQLTVRLQTYRQTAEREAEGLPTTGGVINKNNQVFLPRDPSISYTYRLNSDTPAPEKVEKNWMVLGPQMTLRAEGSAAANRLPESGTMEVIFPNGKTMPFRIVKTMAKPGSTSRDSKDVLLVATIDMTQYIELIPGAPRLQPPDSIKVKVRLPPAQTAGPQAPVSGPSLEEKKPKKRLVGFLPGWARRPLHIAVMALGLIFSVSGQPATSTPSTPLTPSAKQEIVLTNRGLATQAPLDIWITEKISVERFRRLDPSDLMEIALQNNTEQHHAFDRERAARQRLVARLATNQTFTIRLDQARAPGFALPPRADPTTLFHFGLTETQRDQLISGNGNMSPLLRGLGFSATSDREPRNTELLDRVVETEMQIATVQMPVTFESGARTLWQLYFQLLKKDVEIERLRDAIAGHDNILQYLNSKAISPLERERGSAPTEALSNIIEQAEASLTKTFMERQNIEAAIVTQFGSDDDKAAYVKARVASLQSNNALAAQFTYLRPDLSAYNVTPQALYAIRPEFRKADQRLREALTSALVSQKRNTAENLANVSTLSVLDPRTNNFIQTVFLGAKSSVDPAGTSLLEKAAYSGPAFIDLFYGLPPDWTPGLLPIDDILLAEQRLQDLRIEMEENSQRPDYAIGGAIQPSLDFSHGIPTLLRGVLTFRYERPLNAEGSKLRKEEALLQIRDRRRSLETIQKNQAVEFANEMAQRRSAQQAASQALAKAIRNVDLVVASFSADEGQRASGETREQRYLNWLQIRQSLYEAKMAAVESAELRTIVSLKTKRGLDLEAEQLFEHYHEVIEKIKRLPLDEKPKPATPEKKPWWKDILDSFTVPFRASNTTPFRYPGLMRGLIDKDDINSYILGRMTIPNSLHSKQMRQGWGMRETENGESVPEDTLVQQKAAIALARLEDPKALFNMAYLLNLNPTPQETAEELRAKIYERFVALLNQTTFHFNGPEGTGFHLPFFRTNAGTGAPEFVAMHFGTFNNRRNIYVLSHSLWESLMTPENEAALLGALLYEMTKVEWRFADKNNLAYQLESGDALLGETDPLRGTEWAAADKYQKRALRLLWLADPTDRLGWFGLEKEYRSRTALDFNLDEPAQTPAANGIFVDLVKQDLSRKSLYGTQSPTGHNPYRPHEIPRTSHDTDTGLLQSYLALWESVIPAWALTYYAHQSEKFLAWWQRLWNFITFTSYSYPLTPARAAYKAHQFDGPRYGLSRVTSSMVSRLEQIYRFRRGITFAEQKRVHYVVGPIVLGYLLYKLYAIVGVRDAFNDFYTRSEFFSTLSTKTSADDYEFIKNAAELFVVTTIAFSKLIIEGIPILLSILLVILVVLSSIGLSKKFNARTTFNADDVFDQFGNNRTQQAPKGQIARVSEGSAKAIAYYKGLLYMASSVVLEQFYHGVPWMWRLLLMAIRRSPAIHLPPGIKIHDTDRVQVPTDDEVRHQLLQETAVLNPATGVLQVARIAQTQLQALGNSIFVFLAWFQYGLSMPSAPQRETEKEQAWAELFTALLRLFDSNARLLFPDAFEHHERYDMKLGVLRFHHRLRLALQDGNMDDVLLEALQCVYQPADSDETRTWNRLVQGHTKTRQNVTAGDLDIIFRWASRLSALRSPNAVADLIRSTRDLYPQDYLSDHLLKGETGYSRIHMAQALEAMIDADWLMNRLVETQADGHLYDDRPIFLEASLLSPTDPMRDIELLEKITSGRIYIFTSDPVLQPFVDSLLPKKPFSLFPKAQEHRFEVVKLSLVKMALQTPSSALVFLPPEESSWELTAQGRATFVRVPTWLFLKSALVYTYRNFDYGIKTQADLSLWNEIHRHETEILRSMLDTDVYVESQEGDFTSPSRRDTLFVLNLGVEQNRREGIIQQQKIQPQRAVGASS